MTIVEPVEEIKAHIDAFYEGKQAAFAKATGFSTSYISDVLAKNRPPSEKLLSVFGLERAVIRSGDVK